MNIRTLLIGTLSVLVGYAAAAAAHTDNGGPGQNYLLGHNHVDELHGADSADRVEGRGDDDTVTGDEGFDKVNGEGGNDRAAGGKGADDWVMGGCGNDNVLGGEGSDPVVNEGPCGRDSIEGQEDNDGLFGHQDGGNTPDDFHGGGGYNVCYIDADSSGHLERSLNNCDGKVYFYEN